MKRVKVLELEDNKKNHNHLVFWKKLKNQTNMKFVLFTVRKLKKTDYVKEKHKFFVPEKRNTIYFALDF